jgi:hypothetical protein
LKKMNKDKLILKNGAEIELEAGAYIGALQVLSADRAAMLATWELLTQDNLSQVQVKSGDGRIVGTHTDLVLASEASVVASDGTVLTTYSLRPKSDVERLAERLDAVEETTDILTMDVLTGGENA